MGKASLIIGPSGSGKSTSLRNLNPKETFIFSTLGKGLPFKSSKKNYSVWQKETNPDGNMIITSSTSTIIKWLQHINKNLLHVRTVVIDDSTFLPAKELDRRRDEMGYQKFNDIAHDFLAITEISNTLRDDLNIYFLHHSKEDGDGILEDKTTKALSHGKMIDEKLASIEAQFELVFLACKIKTSDDQLEYKFKTRDVNSTAKTPMGMFEDQLIDNDLNLINNAISCYYEDDCSDEQK